MYAAAWYEVGDGVFYRRYESVNVNVGLVIGGDGALLVDTRAAPSQGFETAAHVRDLTSLPVRWVVNTHHHWDHTFGNGAFFSAEIWGHPRCREAMIAGDEAARAQAVTWEPELADELLGGSPAPPERLVEKSARLDLGGRMATLAYLGRSHTDGDIVVRLGDETVAFAGDMLESGAPPWFGDAFPVEWADTAGRLLAGDEATFVPGHGPALSRPEAEAQVADLRAVAGRCRRTFAEGTDPDRADLAGAPYPDDVMRLALRRGHLELQGA